ncbi:hypothetical protein BDV93DRAFT_358569 [Ceratobasidium sp. AG-I]|nr:hypothetical protein BDV93DRAFT_358569 [Ceratobasidium sp. AG-I]
MSGREKDAAIALVAPHMRSLCSLDYFVTSSDNDRSIMACWLKYGVPGSLTRLSVRAQNKGRTTNEFLPENSGISYPVIARFLRPIRSLGLSEVTMDWACAAFYGLVELEIGNVQSTNSPTAAQFAAILAASPQIHSIKLYRMLVQSSEDTQIILVELLQLQELYLELEPLSYERLVLMLRPCWDELRLHLVIDSHNQDLFGMVATLLCKHWAQVRITALHLGGGPFAHSLLRRILSKFRSIHTPAELVLVNGTMREQAGTI